MFKWLYNESKSGYNVTVVVPTYKNTKFLMECLNSIFAASKKCNNFELLLGIDNCHDTLKLIANNTFLLNKKLRVFFFPKNVGPYIIRNTLACRAKYENILFFDSDDIMMENMLETLLSKFENKKVLKFKFYNFQNDKGYHDIENLTLSPIFGHGVFLIKKSR